MNEHILLPDDICYSLRSSHAQKVPAVKKAIDELVENKCVAIF